MLKLSYSLILCSILFTSCKKVEGTGGTSAIRGKVIGTKLASAGQAESTEVICTGGAFLEHGDYWLLNSSNTAKYYYIYYVNPTWISDANPHLLGRIGIPVSFNYSDSNLDIAQKTQIALSGITAAPFTVSRTQDILHIIHNTDGLVPDADNGSTSFAIDIVNQGKLAGLQTTTAAGDQRVYIIYGQNTYYSNTVRTNEKGEFSFEGLRNGNYTVYVLGNDPQHANASLKTEKSIMIDSKESIKDIGEFDIYF